MLRALGLPDQPKDRLSVGDCSHTVTQAYCSALPVAYSGLPEWQWEEFARLVLEAAYEASLYAAVLNAERTGNNRVFPTLLGGGSFGNRPEWIVGAIRRALELYGGVGLDAAIVSYGSPSRSLDSFSVEAHV